MKLTTQLAVLIGILFLGLAGLILGLAVLADWSDGAIIGMVSLFSSIATGLIVAVRNQQRTTETLDQLQQQVGAGQRTQDAKLTTVVQQTNGPTTRERELLARETAAATVAELKNGGHL